MNIVRRYQTGSLTIFPVILSIFKVIFNFDSFQQQPTRQVQYVHFLFFITNIALFGQLKKNRFSPNYAQISRFRRISSQNYVFFIEKREKCLETVKVYRKSGEVSEKINSLFRTHFSTLLTYFHFFHTFLYFFNSKDVILRRNPQKCPRVILKSCTFSTNFSQVLLFRRMPPNITCF